MERQPFDSKKPAYNPDADNAALARQLAPLTDSERVALLHARVQSLTADVDSYRYCLVEALDRIRADQLLMDRYNVIIDALRRELRIARKMV